MQDLPQYSWLMLKNQIYLGSDEFIEKVQNNITGKGLSERNTQNSKAASSQEP